MTFFMLFFFANSDTFIEAKTFVSHDKSGSNSTEGSFAMFAKCIIASILF